MIEHLTKSNISVILKNFHVTLGHKPHPSVPTETRDSRTPIGELVTHQPLSIGWDEHILSPRVLTLVGIGRLTTYCEVHKHVT